MVALFSNYLLKVALFDINVLGFGGLAWRRRKNVQPDGAKVAKRRCCQVRALRLCVLLHVLPRMCVQCAHLLSTLHLLITQACTLKTTPHKGI